MTREDFSYKLDLISRLTTNWDGYGAPVIGNMAIAKCRSLISSLPDKTLLELEVNPTEFGGISVRLENPTKRTKISIDLGDKVMSYYVIKGSESPQFYSFLPYSKNNFDNLISLIESISD